MPRSLFCLLQNKIIQVIIYAQNEFKGKPLQYNYHLKDYKKNITSLIISEDEVDNLKLNIYYQ